MRDGSSGRTYLRPLLRIHSSHTADSAAPRSPMLKSNWPLWVSSSSLEEASGSQVCAQGGWGVEEVGSGWPLPLLWAVGGVKRSFCVVCFF